MAVDIEKLTARSAEVATRIEALREQLDPLRAELASLNRRIAGARLGQTTTARRAEKTKKRNRAIGDAAENLDGLSGDPEAPAVFDGALRAK